MADLTNQLQAAAGASTGVASDADFENTVLLLHGDGTNGAQNNTFIDSSTNNFTITRNGNTTQGTFSPFSKPDGRWGNYFDGTGDTLSLADNAAFTLGSGDFTIECWIYNGTTGGDRWIAAQNDSAGNVSSRSFAIYKTSGNKFAGQVGSSSTPYVATSSADLPLNQWVHVAFVRDGNTTRNYINGVQDGTANVTGVTVNNSANQLVIGSLGESSASSRWEGYISNFRQVVGTCLYPGGTTFTPPTAPLTAITNTSLLTCQSNRFIDNSSNNFAITRNGDVRVTPFSPFPITTAYSTSVNGGAGYFDGSGDYLTAPDNTAFAMGTGDFTIEGWVYTTSSTTTEFAFLDTRNSDLDTNGFVVYRRSTGKLTFGYVVGNTFIAIESTTNLQQNSWNHFAFTRESGTLRSFLNGVLENTTGSLTNNFSRQSNTRICATWNSTNVALGYLSNFRWVKGSALYTSSFTPSTAPLTAITNTSLLLNFTNAGIFDNTGFNALETVGNAQIDTTTKKYGTGSMEFDTSGDSLNGLSDPNLNMGTGDWTIEGWVNVTSRNTNYPLVIGNNNGSFTAGALALTVSNSDNASYNDRFVLAAHDMGATGPDRLIVASSTNSTGVWYHFAVVRNGTNLSIYRDGTSVGSKTISAGVVFDWGKGGLRIGGNNWDGAQSYFNGYIDDLRITKGIARYTTTFTPPTAAFKDIGA
jgi:hypothetical protein